jgi:hypothetical protein
MGKFVFFVKALLSNRPGIVLATLNVCYFAARDFFIGVFPLSNFDKIMLSQNAPAIVLTFIPHHLIHFLFSQMEWLMLQRLTLVILTFFITLQWLFIGWTAKTMARKLGKRKTNNGKY